MSTQSLTPRGQFIAALERRPLPGLVPTFELVFFLTMEVFGKVHPSHRSYHQWLQMTERERALQRQDMAALYVDTARRFGHHAIFLHPNPNDTDETCRLIDAVRDLSGDEFFLMLHGDPTIGIPDGQGMEELSLQMLETPELVDGRCQKGYDWSLRRAEVFHKHGGLDGFALCSDYCFNTGSFLPLPWFDRFITPYLTKIVKTYRDMGFYVIKHTDGNIMPILDRLLEARPHALHSLDPQGGVDMAEMVRLCADKVALCGNVNCGLLQTGTDEECVASAKYAIDHGLKAPGYIFCTSNCVYTGMELRRYELILDVYRQHAVRPSK